MDPVSLILAALAAGATAATKDTASQAIKDAYGGLKNLILKYFVKKPQAEMALGEYEQDEDTWKKPLHKALVEVGADQDEALVRQSQHLLTLIHPQQAAQGKFNVQIGEGKGVVIGDYSQVEQHFGKE